MNHLSRQTIAFVTGAVAVVGLGIGGIAMAQDDKPSEPTLSVQDTTDEAGSSIYLMECNEEILAEKPDTFTVACGDGNANLSGLEWSDWGTEQAHAVGDLVVNTCDPTCADGTLETVPVEVTAGDLTRGEAIGTYGTLKLHFTGNQPEGFDQDEVLHLTSVGEGVTG